MHSQKLFFGKKARICIRTGTIIFKIIMDYNDFIDIFLILIVLQTLLI